MGKGGRMATLQEWGKEEKLSALRNDTWAMNESPKLRKGKRRWDGTIVSRLISLIAFASMVLIISHRSVHGVINVALMGPELSMAFSEREFFRKNNSVPILIDEEEATRERITLASGMTCRIPKLLHQTYKTDVVEDWPVKEWANYLESWLRNHPESEGWSRKFWTDLDNRRLLETYYPEYVSIYNGIQLGVSKADFMRMIYMHLYGGVYADMDMASHMPMEAFFDQHPEACEDGGVVLGHMGDVDDKDSVPNAFLVSEPGHPLWRYCIETAPRHVIAVEARYGPIHLKRCVKAFTENNISEDIRTYGGFLDKPTESTGAVFLAQSAYFFPYNWADPDRMPYCTDYRDAILEVSFIDGELRGKCEDELRESAGFNPITYTIWCHSWGQFFERSKVTSKIMTWLGRIHPKLSEM